MLACYFFFVRAKGGWEGINELRAKGWRNTTAYQAASVFRPPSYWHGSYIPPVRRRRRGLGLDNLGQKRGSGLRRERGRHSRGLALLANPGDDGVEGRTVLADVRLNAIDGASRVLQMKSKVMSIGGAGDAG